MLLLLWGLLVIFIFAAGCVMGLLGFGLRFVFRRL